MRNPSFSYISPKPKNSTRKVLRNMGSAAMQDPWGMLLVYQAHVLANIYKYLHSCCVMVERNEAAAFASGQACVLALSAAHLAPEDVGPGVDDVGGDDDGPRRVHPPHLPRYTGHRPACNCSCSPKVRIKHIINKADTGNVHACTRMSCALPCKRIL